MLIYIISDLQLELAHSLQVAFIHTYSVKDDKGNAQLLYNVDEKNERH